MEQEDEVGRTAVNRRTRRRHTRRDAQRRIQAAIRASNVSDTGASLSPRQKKSRGTMTELRMNASRAGKTHAAPQQQGDPPVTSRVASRREASALQGSPTPEHGQWIPGAQGWGAGPPRSRRTSQGARASPAYLVRNPRRNPFKEATLPGLRSRSSIGKDDRWGGHKLAAAGRDEPRSEMEQAKGLTTQETHGRTGQQELLRRAQEQCRRTPSGVGKAPHTKARGRRRSEPRSERRRRTNHPRAEDGGHKAMRLTRGGGGQDRRDTDGGGHTIICLYCYQEPAGRRGLWGCAQAEKRRP